MSALVDLRHKRFGKLYVRGRSRRRHRRHGAAWWLCSCDCGVSVPIRSDLLTRGLKTSCGCVTTRVLTTIDPTRLRWPILPVEKR